MSPRTPVAVVLGTLVTVSLFGLMQSMVRQPEVFNRVVLDFLSFRM